MLVYWKRTNEIYGIHMCLEMAQYRYATEGLTFLRRAVGRFTLLNLKQVVLVAPIFGASRLAFIETAARDALQHCYTTLKPYFHANDSQLFCVRSFELLLG